KTSNAYFNLAHKTPRVIEKGLLAVADGGNKIIVLAQFTSTGIHRRINSAITSSGAIYGTLIQGVINHTTTLTKQKDQLVLGINTTANAIKNPVYAFAFSSKRTVLVFTRTVLNKTSKTSSRFKTGFLMTKESIIKPASEEAHAFLGRVKVATHTFGAIVFDKEPTRITDLKVEEIGKDYAIIVWRTNHYATSKVSYGFTFDYGKSIQSNERVKEHRIKITEL
ncbi:unnamed protein product, partial [marine sediment metagenome]